MSFHAVKQYFESVGMGQRVMELSKSSATVGEAAEAIGCEPKQIAKTMSFMVEDSPILIVAAGDAKIDNKKYKAEFHQKAKMISTESVKDFVGHAPGGVCPFALPPDVKVYLDVSLKRFDRIYPAGGSGHSAVELTLEELMLHSSYIRWVDVCKGWFVKNKEADKMETSDNLLKQAYSVEGFQKEAHQLVDIIAEQLAVSQNGKNQKTIDLKSPDEELEIWEREFFSSEKSSIIKLAEKLFSNSINFHSKGYMGHQVSVTLPVTTMTAALIAYLNNCTTVYELGMAGNAMEKVVISHIAEKYGYNKGATGFVTSGGSMGNLTALVTARTSSGIAEEDFGKLAIMTSSESHYSVSRAAKIMGIKTDNIILVPSGNDFTMRTDLLEDIYQKAVSEEKIVFCIVGCACTTSVGAYDDLEKIADFASEHQIWFHVDGAHGGAAIFSRKYKYLLKGIERSDSLIVDFHKMMMAPPLSTAVIYNSGNRKINEFSPKAVYLWQDQISEEWYNSAKHTLECTKPLTIIHTYAILRLYGDEIYQQYVDTLFDMGKTFAKMIKACKNMEIVMEPLSNIVCFRYLSERQNPDTVNKKIAEELLKDGTFYIVNTTIHGNFYLRVTLMNPMTDEKCLAGLLSEILEIAKRNDIDQKEDI